MRETTKRPSIHAQDNLLIYASYFNSTKFSDFTIITSDQEKIPAHRMVLDANSRVFQAMFAVTMTESRLKTITIDDIDSETMLEILRFMYHQSVVLIKELAPKILYGAVKYEIDQLKNMCVLSMVNNLSVDNALQYVILADLYNEKYLMEKCLRFAKM